MSNRNPGKGMVCARPSRTIPWDSTNSRMMDNAGVYAAANRFNILSAWSSLCTSRCTRETCSSIQAARRLDSRRSSSRLATEEASRNPARRTWFRNVSSSRGKCRQGYGHALLSYPHPYLDEYREMGRRARMLNKGVYAEQEVHSRQRSEQLAPFPPSGTGKPLAEDAVAFSTRLWGWVGPMLRSQPPMNRPRVFDSVSIIREGREI